MCASSIIFSVGPSCLHQFGWCLCQCDAVHVDQHQEVWSKWGWGTCGYVRCTIIQPKKIVRIKLKWPYFFCACDYVECILIFIICQKSNVVLSLNENFLLWKYSLDTAFGNQTHSGYVSKFPVYTLDILGRVNEPCATYSLNNILGINNFVHLYSLFSVTTTRTSLTLHHHQLTHTHSSTTHHAHNQHSSQTQWVNWYVVILYIRGSQILPTSCSHFSKISPTGAFCE